MATPGSAAPLARYWYGATVPSFLGASDREVLGSLAAASVLEVTPEQRGAWMGEIEILRRALTGIEGHLFLEFTIPRMGLRADAILLAAGLIFVLEFKQGAGGRAALDQVWDYALDLKNFHAGSHGHTIVPILVAAAPPTGSWEARCASDGVVETVTCKPDELRQLLQKLCAQLAGPEIAAEIWASTPYRPTPTIIEAARALYTGHGVEEIQRSDAKNLALTSGCVQRLMKECRQRGRKAICFVTGVPGSGKTLVGLKLAAPGLQGKPHGVYLSGNGPLVAVLVEALARDEVKRSGKRKGDARRSARTFIQNVHHYRDEYFRSEGAPHEHYAIFDEAQRAWDQPHLANWLQRRRRNPGCKKSEAAVLLTYLDRHRDWAFVVCLVGEGQEINSGEAGIEAWLQAVQEEFPDWEVYQPCDLPDLHLAVSVRSFRSESVSGFVQAALAGERMAAKDCLGKMGEYPVALTRDLSRAQRWLRDQARGSERTGLLVSSKAERLRPHAIDVRVKTDPVHWFLDDKDDLRSSSFLEAAATEFDVQGLEVDWAGVIWDGDLRKHGQGWSHHRFQGAKWQTIHSENNQRYQLNAYRVLLTRARQGMVLCVPRGEPADYTRKPEYYDSTYEYFASLGVPVLS